MDSKVKIILAVVICLILIISIGILQTLKSGDGVGSNLNSDALNAQRTHQGGKVVRAKVPMRNAKYYYPDRSRPRKKIDPNAMDKKEEFIDEPQDMQQMSLPAGMDPNELQAQGPEAVQELWMDDPLQQEEGHSADFDHNY